MPPSDPPSYGESGSWIPDLSTGMNLFEASTPGPELPAYSLGPRSTSSSSRPHRQPEETKEFQYGVMKGGEEVVTLIIIAMQTYSKNIPTFLQGSPVKGAVRLNLEKPDFIQSVDLTILGKYITGPDPEEILTFMDVSQNLWSLSDGHPRNTLGNGGDQLSQLSSSRTGTNFSGKLQGVFSWPFSLDIPNEVAVPCGSREEIRIFSPPQTFNERLAHASIAYEIVVKVKRSKWKTNYPIFAPFGYIPCIRPPPLPPLRKLAYQENRSLVGPTTDLEGWYGCKPVKVEGKIFNNRPSDVVCTLYLANPLHYTRGSLIPFCLRLEGGDQQALDLLSPPKAITVRLKRVIQYHFDPDNIRHMEDTINYSDRAVLWPSSEGSGDSTQLRFVNGELHIKPDTKPSSAVGNFRIQYSLVLFPFDAAGFDPVDSHPVIEQPVEITTLYASGPRPKRFAPPGYESGALLGRHPSWY